MQVRTISQARQYNYKIPGLDAKAEGALKYIEHLGAVTNTDVTDCPIGIFKNSNGNIHVDRSSINKVFFEWKSKIAEKPQAPMVIKRDRVLGAERQLQNVLVSMEYTALSTLQAKERSVRNFSNQLSAAEKEMAKAKLSYTSLRSRLDAGIDLTRDVNAILADGWWQYDDSGDGLRFVTPEIVLSYFNTKQQASSVVRMGQLLVILNVYERGIYARVHPWKDNPRAGNYFHPHVCSDYTICFGDAKAEASARAAGLDFPGYMNIIKSVLTSYCADNPYRFLHEFDPSWVDPDEEEPEYSDEDREPEYNEDQDELGTF